MSSVKAFVSAFLVLVLYGACTYEKMPADCAAPATVSFQQDILPILNQQCSLADCHSGAYPAGNLNLEAPVAYTQLTQPGKGYIDTITPEFSVIYASMNSTSDPMPPTGKLDKCSVELVYEWIAQKAKNN